MDKVEVEVIAVSTQLDQKGQSNVIILQQVGGERVFSFEIAPDIANSLIMALSGVETSRPFTHQLILNILAGNDVSVEEVIIEKYSEKDKAFVASIVANRNGELQHIDSRPSDAITIAVLSRKKIYVEEITFFKWSKSMNHPNVTSEEKVKDEYEDLPVSVLKTKLKELLENEDYAEAAKIRDLIIEKEKVI